jgi:hypothetical protein
MYEVVFVFVTVSREINPVPEIEWYDQEPSSTVLSRPQSIRDAFNRYSVSCSRLTELMRRYPHVMNGLNGPTAPKYTYLVFYSSVVNGKMWCPVSSLTLFKSLR